MINRYRLLLKSVPLTRIFLTWVLPAAVVGLLVVILLAAVVTNDFLHRQFYCALAVFTLVYIIRHLSHNLQKPE